MNYNKTVKSKIFSAAAIVSIFTAIVQICGFAKELAVAAWFGTGDALDAFLIALLVPTFIVNVLAGSLSASFLPTFIRVYQNEGVTGAQRILTGVTTWFIVFGLLLSVVLIVFSPFYLPLLCAGFSPQKLKLSQIIMYALTPIILLKGLSTIYAGVLNSLETFALPAGLPGLGPIAIIVLIFTVGSSIGIYALAIGTVLGFGLETFLIGGALINRNFSLRPRLIRLGPELKIVIGQFLPMVAGAIIMGGTELVDKGMAAALAPGSVAALNYGNKIIAAILALATTAIGTAVLPYFARMVAENDKKNIRSTLKFYLRLVFAFGIPAAILIFGLSNFIIRIFYQRGSFTAADTMLVSSVQALYSFQIPFYIASIVVVRLISSLRANHILMWGAVVNLIANIGFNIVFIYYLGLEGIALSTSFVYLLSFMFLYHFANKLIPREQASRIG